MKKKNETKIEDIKEYLDSNPIIKEKKAFDEVDVDSSINFKKGQANQENIEKVRMTIYQREMRRVNNKYNILIIIVFSILIALLLIYNELGKSAYKSCIANGNSEKWCIEHI